MLYVCIYVCLMLNLCMYVVCMYVCRLLYVCMYACELSICAYGTTKDGSIPYCDRGLNVDDTATDSTVKNVVDSTTVTSLNELSEVYDRLCLVSLYVCMYVCVCMCISVYMV